MNIAYLLNSVVLLIAPEGYTPPKEFVYDATRDATGANVGDTWDGEKYVRPVVEAPRQREISPADFMRRFTVAEWCAANELRKTDGLMAYFFEMLRLVPVVHLDHTDTQQGVGYMAQQGILTSARATEILA
jgi:hypothetical protein